QQERYTAAALGELERGVDRASDRLHVVLQTQEEARDQLAALGLAGVEERRSGGLEAARHDLVADALGDPLIAAAEGERGDGHPVLEALQVPLPIEGLERVRGVVLERTEEGGEAELVAVGPLEERLDEGRVVLLEDLRLVVVVLDQVRELLLEVVDEHRAG